MSLFDQWPYTNFHELNLDWIMESLRELEHTIDQFVSINALKYADPIQWNITRQYEKNTIVIDPLTGTAYISVQPVPSGVALTRDEYWTVVFDLGSFVVRAAKNFTDRWESQWTLTATFPSTAGDWLVWNDTLYKVISNIVAGDQYVIDSNIRHFTIEDIIGHLEDLTTTDKSNLVAAINEVLQTIGDLDDLNTTDKSNVVAAINEVLQTLTDTTGDLDDLNTIDKSNVVAAINEVLQTLTDTTGDLDDLNTTDKTNLVAAINEDTDRVSKFEISKPINVLTLGIDNTGTEDVTDAINAALTEHSLYFPYGVYKISKPIIATNNIIGAGNTHGSSVPNDNYPERTHFRCDATFTGDAAIIINGDTPVILKDFDITLHDTEHGIDITPSSEKLFNKIDSVSIINITSFGIYVAPSVWISKPVYISNCCLWGKQYQNSTGMYFNNNATDCMITRTWIMGIQRGILNEYSVLILADMHIWCGTYSGSDQNNWWAGTVGIESKSGHITATNLYIDSPLVIFKGDQYGDIHVNNFVVWYDQTMTGSSRYDATMQYQFTNGQIVIDNGYIRVTDRMKYVFADIIITNNFSCIYDAGTVIQSSSNPMIFPTLKENNCMYLKPNGADVYQEVACIYIPYYGSVELIVASSYTNNTRLVVVRDVNNIYVKQYDLISTESYYYTYASGYLTIYRHVDPAETLTVTLIEATKDTQVYNYNLMKYSDNTNYTRKHQNDTTGLTAITPSNILRSKWYQYVAQVTVPANGTLNQILPLNNGPRELDLVMLGMVSQSVDNNAVAIQNCEFTYQNGVRTILRNHSSAAVTCTVEVWYAFGGLNKPIL